ncbi:putative phage abortive infection protein [Arcobacter cryaerophilus gv. pseudocryaerophilus]|uniref:Phage abortive infection protein n=3 Tax=unclassified Arcobacter TaxID=2593671 RepID=A0AA96DHV0_9BACT|nr:putative phage abortive infection protein [Arcobacter sp. AZ-2023]WPD04696.1 putative phage abortive infection protein [Arcobacter sp. DSM 115956]WPD06791.1 putative phage abortive infection protein [Arcobacter sp. DSM 115955]WNL31056.1 putative phage abortive infection protein [Arcobacter sp. AZ-2023]WNP37206.1 putative phage abortive infection protein [Arcobacter sp. AZ-2023]
MEEKKEKLSIKAKIWNFFEEWFAVISMIGGLLIFISALVAYSNNYNEPAFNIKYSVESIDNENSVESLGQFGDFLGGTLNPIFAFLSYCLLLITIKIQNKSLKTSQEELELTRMELSKSATALQEQSNSIKIQNFENTFFNMINLHNEVIRNIKINTNMKFYPEKEYPYNAFLSTDSFIKSNEFDYGKYAINTIVQRLDTFSSECSKYKLFNHIYNSCYENIQIHLGQYFENIYEIFNFIYSNKSLNYNQKKMYVNLFRAQFSSMELRLLFYHCASNLEKENFKKYIEEYNFFEYLDLEKNNYNFKFILSRSIYNNSAFNNKKVVEYINELINNLNKEKDVSNDKPYESFSLLYLLKDDLNALAIMENHLQTIEDVTSKQFLLYCIDKVKEEINKSNSSSQEPQ